MQAVTCTPCKHSIDIRHIDTGMVNLSKTHRRSTPCKQRLLPHSTLTLKRWIAHIHTLQAAPIATQHIDIGAVGCFISVKSCGHAHLEISV